MQAGFDGRGEFAPQAGGILARGQRLFDAEVGLPVAADFQPAPANLIWAIDGQMARRQFAHALPDRARMRHVLVGQIFVQGLRVDMPRHAGDLQEALQLAGKQQSARLMAVDQRLLAQAIAGQKQQAALGVPQGEGEHAVQQARHFRAFVFIQMDQGFGVALRLEAMSAALQAASQGGEVIDLAVENDPHGPLLVGQRLPSAGHVDDRQPPVPQGHARQTGPAGTQGQVAAVKALVVRAAVAEHVGHAAQGVGVDGKSGLDPGTAGNAAHISRNPKSEYRNPKQISNLKFQISNTLNDQSSASTVPRLIRAFEFPSFGFVSDFDIRVSDFLYFPWVLR